MRVAVIGGGWAGFAAAVAATRAGHAVTLFEAARTPGGRARALPAPDGDAVLDNGQHILIGAYTATLAVMRGVGVDVDTALLRLPLSLRFADDGGIALPAWPAPLDVLAGIATARGWRWRERWALLRTAAGWQRAGFVCAPGATVANLCAALPVRVRNELIDPLCISALNTPAARASGAVFLRVLRDALFAGAGGSNLLLPRTDLGALFPVPAARWLSAHGGAVRCGQRVARIAPADGGWQVDDARFDRVVLATAAADAVRLLADVPAAASWCRVADALRYEAIATVYAQWPGAVAGAPALTRPMLALRDSASAPAQFVFDRGQLGGPAGLLAFVVSASAGDRETLQAQVLAQAREQLGLGLHAVLTVVEKRATFACSAGLQRPAMHIAPGLLACGDYVDGPYPATLEGAVRSGDAAATGLSLASA